MENLSKVISKFDKNVDLKLERYFNESMEDANFKKLVNRLNMPNKELMKYTSKLQKTANELSHCQNCKNVLECNHEVEGYIYYPTANGNNLIFDYIPCKYQKKLEKENKFKENISLFEMPTEIKNAKMKDIYTDDKNRLETIKWMKHFLDNYEKDKKIKGIYLTGNFGSGKTYLLSAMLNELAKSGHKVAIIFFPDFLRTLKSNFGDEDYNRQFEYIRNVELLLIDDIGAETTTAWSRDEVLGTILQYRMEENLKTFFTSNLTIEELEENLSVVGNRVDKVKSRRIIERIKFMTDQIHLISANKRKDGNKNEWE